MGWTYTRNATKQDIIQDCLTAGEHPTGFRAIRHSVVGNHLWVAFENETSEHYEKGHRFLALYLLAGDRNYGWGCKAIQESMGPSDCDCPLYLLDIVPPADSEYAAGFRDRVRAYHAQKAEARDKKTALKVGDKLELPEGCRPRSFTVAEVGNRIFAYGDDGRRYHVPPRFIARATVIAA